MPAQISLDGFEPPPRLTDRLFFAVFPPVDVAAQIAHHAQSLRAQHGLSGHPLKTERFHVTLHHLGDHAGLRKDIVVSASVAATAVKQAPFDLSFDRALSFTTRTSQRPFVLRGSDEGLAAVIAFQQSLGDAMKRAALREWVDPRFTPHVTLLYDDREVPEQAIEPVRWTATEFALVHSLIGQTRHIVLGRWPFAKIKESTS